MQFARVGALVGAVTAAVAATVFAAVPASAHTPTVEAACVDKVSTLTVNLKDYRVEQGKKNTVVVTVDDQAPKSFEFGKDFSQTFTAEPATVEHEYKVEVKAWDDPTGDLKFTRSFDRSTEACVKNIPPTTTTTTTTTTTAPTTTTTVEETTTTVETTTESSPAATTTTEVAVVPAGDTEALASTGASIAIPLVIGLVLLGGGAALLVVLRKRAANN